MKVVVSLLVFAPYTSAQSQNYEGWPHTALGQAVLDDSSGSLMLQNIGSSGQDGVRIELGEIDGGFGVQIDLQSVDDGGRFVVGGEATINSVPGSPVFTLTAEFSSGPVGTIMELEPDFAALGSMTYSVVLLLGDLTVQLPVIGLSGPIQVNLGGEGKCPVMSGM